MSRKSNREKRIRGRQRRFAAGTDHHIVTVEQLKACTSWDDAMALAEAEIAARKITTVTKKRGAINFLRFSERATMLPTRYGPILLPWDWSDHSLRSRVRTLIHEVTHHEQDRAIVTYEALYLHPGWRWAIEVECFAVEVWVMAAAMRWPGAYTEAQINAWIDRLSRSFPKSYPMRGYDPAAVTLETRSALIDHKMRAFAAFSVG